MTHERRFLGIRGELAAADFLRHHYYVILETNYRCRFGEIDLVALDGTTIVFVEVKTRTQEGYGSPFDAVDDRKQRQIVRTAEFYIVTHDLNDRDARFDVVGVWEEGDRITCELIRNAFET